jgi:hypothetical protein
MSYFFVPQMFMTHVGFEVLTAVFMKSTYLLGYKAV